MLKKSLLALAVSSIGVMSLPALADTYEIDAKGAHASINFAVKHLGYSWLTGRFDTFSGEFTYDPAKPEASTINVTIDTTSVNSNHAERDKHLRGKDFLDTGSFPTAKFESTGVKIDGDKATITGNLTLHGVTKEIEIDATRVGGGEDPWGGQRQGFTGTTTLPLKDFGINYNLGPSATAVELALEIEGVRK